MKIKDMIITPQPNISTRQAAKNGKTVIVWYKCIYSWVNNKGTTC